MVTGKKKFISVRPTIRKSYRRITATQLFVKDRLSNSFEVCPYVIYNTQIFFFLFNENILTQLMLRLAES